MSAVSPVSSRSLRLRVPTVDVRVVTGVLLVAVSVIGGLRLTAPPGPSTSVYVAATDLDVGHVLTGADLREEAVRAPASLTRTLERVAAGAPVGRVVRSPLRAGAPVPVDVLGAVRAPGRDLTVPVTPEHALGGVLRPGDRIDVLASFDKGTDAARTLTVARDAIVRGVTRADGLFGQRAGALTAVTVTVDPDAAVALAFAARNGELDIVRSRGLRSSGARARFDVDSLR
jgi:Flp pilus assembly protein CpaB